MCTRRAYRTPERMRRVALLLLVHTLLCAGAARAELLLVFAVSRHGARNALPKSALLQEPAGGVTLLPLGQRQCYNAGAALRARYLESGCSATSTCLLLDGAAASALYGVVGAPGVAFSNFNLLARSSALDRTLLSARSFLSGACFAARCWMWPLCPFRRSADPSSRAVLSHPRAQASSRRFRAW
jgi:hypothetical protein